MQKDDVLISDIKDALADAVENLRDLKNDETELPFESECSENGEMVIKGEATNLPHNVLKIRTNYLKKNVQESKNLWKYIAKIIRSKMFFKEDKS